MPIELTFVKGIWDLTDQTAFQNLPSRLEPQNKFEGKCGLELFFREISRASY